ncbi:MAG: amidohydrolase family protein [Proteobacteria bacterium]|nr:amidohydrolase family protein [Pseudomonadota bacterium]
MLTKKLFQPVADRVMSVIAALAADPSTKPLAHSKADAKNGMVVTNCKVVDVVSGRVLDNSSVLIRGGVIKSIRQGMATGMGDVEVLDLGGRYLIPGLIDAHCHISVSSTFSILPTIGDAARNYRQIRRQWATSIESGVTAVRDAGSFPLLRKGLERDVKNGLLKGPRVFHCNSIMNVKGSHPDIPPHHIHPLAKPASLVMGSIGMDFRSDKDLLPALEKNLPQASFIKLTVDNQSMFHGKGEIPVYSNRQLQRIFDFAEGHGLPVACHCGTSWGLTRMLNYPVHSFEHVVSDIPLPDKVIQTLADRNISVVPTMSVGSAYVINGVLEHIPVQLLSDFVRNEIERANAYLKNVPKHHCDPKIHAASLKRMALYGKHTSEHLLKKRKYLPEAAHFVRILTTGAKNLLKMRDAGVNIGCGMDAGMPLNYFGALHREIGLLGRIGFTNLEALQTATINSARVIGAAEILGSIEPGKLADLVVVDKNPLEDLSALEKPVLVMKDGRVEHTLLNNGNGKGLDRI